MPHLTFVNYDMSSSNLTKLEDSSGDVPPSANLCSKNYVRQTFQTFVTQEVSTGLNNQQDALIIQIYSVIKLYMFRASSLPTIRNFLLHIRHW